MRGHTNIIFLKGFCFSSFVMFFPLLRLTSFSFFLLPLGNSFHFLGCLPLSSSLIPKNFSGLFRSGFGLLFTLIVGDALAIVSWPMFFFIFYFTICVMGFWDFCLVAGRVTEVSGKLEH